MREFVIRMIFLIIGASFGIMVGALGSAAKCGDCALSKEAEKIKK